MRVAVIDVGSNSVRILIASVKRIGEVRELERGRVYLRLGDDAYGATEPASSIRSPRDSSARDQTR